MGEMVDVTIRVEKSVAARLEEPGMRARILDVVHSMLSRPPSADLMFAIAKLKATAHARGLTDAIVDDELAAWNAERRERPTRDT